MTKADLYLKDGVDGIAPLLSEFRNIGAIDSGAYGLESYSHLFKFIKIRRRI